MRKERISREIIEEVLASYRERRSCVPLNLLKGHGNQNTITGVSEVSLKKFLGDSWKPLIDLIASGDIKGIAGVVGCSNLTAGGHDVLTVDLTKELIARDILVLTAGCSSGGLENCGLMTPEAASLAGPKLRAVCESLGIPPVLNFGPCLAIGRLEMVATELAQALNVDIPQLPPGALGRPVAGGTGAGRRRLRTGPGSSPSPGTSPLHYRQQPGDKNPHRGHEGPYRRTGHCKQPCR